VIELILRHIVDNEKIQAEVMANTAIDFETSPAIIGELEGVIYASAIGCDDAIVSGHEKVPLVAIGANERSGHEGCPLVAKSNGPFPLVRTLEKRPSSHSAPAPIGRFHPRSGKRDGGSQVASAPCLLINSGGGWQGVAGDGRSGSAGGRRWLLR
jgi:hypothetical protein